MSKVLSGFSRDNRYSKIVQARGAALFSGFKKEIINVNGYQG